MSGPSAAALADPPVEVFLPPGAMHCTEVPSRVTTILGSCVAVCLWDKVRQVGGMNHYILPYHRENHPSARFGDFAIERLVEAMRRLGCNRDSLRAKVFGGAAVLPFASGGDPVGDQNVRVALERLHEHGIPVIARRTGGRSGMLIRLFTQSGDVMVRRVAAVAVDVAGPGRIALANQNWPAHGAG